ncbi:glycosyl transferase [Lewinellaceae bacterium SD302]|nr:glycosyl transferase [Lewinellaceae bacterium SD302]
MIKLSVVIITLNEAENLPRCLASVEGLADEILVVDSLSTDDTVKIAAAAGARVIEQAFLGHREQKAFAIENAANNCVLSLDADEALSDELKESIGAAKQNWTHDGYYVNRLNRLNGIWIRHGGWYPDRKMRLFDRRKYRMGGTNPHDRFDPTPASRTTRLAGDLLHYTNDDLDSRIVTINKFSSIAAQAFFDEGKRGNWWRVLVKPTGRFVSEFWLKSGWRDGYYGYYIAKTSAQYVWLREMKLLRLGKAS